MLAASVFLLHGMALHHDAMWQLWIGRQLYHGATLYRDILELNPPLWFWISVPLSALAEGGGLRPGSVLILFFLASMGLALLLLRQLLSEAAAARGIVYAALFIALFAIPLSSFGQREHFALIASVPYIALIARRAAGEAVPLHVAVAIGLFAAAGFGLKHYFLIVPAALEAWHWTRARKMWRPWRPESLALGTAVLTYAISILIFTPNYLTDIVPMIRTAYGSYDRPLAGMLYQPALGLWLLAGLAFALRRRRPVLLSQAALIASVAFLAAYFIQHKGWSYQLVPAAGLLAFAIGAELSAIVAAKPWRTGRAGAVILLAVAAISAAAGFAKGPYSNHYRDPAETALAGLREGDAVMFLSAHASSAWPMVEERRLKWSSRHFVLWMLPAIAQAERSHAWSPALRRLATDTRREAALDAACSVPALIVVDTHRTSGLMRDQRFDTLAFFRREPAFERVMRQYRPVRRSPEFEIHARIADSGGAVPGGCRKIH